MRPIAGRRRLSSSASVLWLLAVGWIVSSVLAADNGHAIRLSFPAAAVRGDNAWASWIQARRLPALPKADGALDEDCWSQAAETERFSVADPPLRQRVPVSMVVGHARGRLCIGGRVQASPGDGDHVDVVLDTLLDHRSCHVLRIAAKGALSGWHLVEEGRFPWKYRCQWAVRRDAASWSFEVLISRRSFADPQNQVIGFNVTFVGRNTLTWNPSASVKPDPNRLGRLAFETAPITVRSVKAGALVRGENNLSVAIGNGSDRPVSIRALLTVREPGGKLSQRRYRLHAPAMKTQVVALGFPLSGPGPASVEALLLDDGLKTVFTGFCRREIYPRQGIRLRDAKWDNGRLAVFADWPFSKRELDRMSLVVTLRAKGGGRTLAVAKRDGIPADRVAAYLSGPPLAAGGYELRLTLARKSVMVASRKLLLSVRDGHTPEIRPVADKGPGRPG